MKTDKTSREKWYSFVSKDGVDISDIVKSMLQTSDGFFDFYIKLSSVCFQLKLGMWENGRLGLE